MIYMFLSNNPSSGDINSSNLSCLYIVWLFKHYRALLLIPDVYNHKHVKGMMDVLLDRLGFGAAIIQQVI